MLDGNSSAQRVLSQPNCTLRTLADSLEESEIAEDLNGRFSAIVRLRICPVSVCVISVALQSRGLA